MEEDTGVLGFDEVRHGSVLKLYGDATSEDIPPTLRVFAGPRRTRTLCGVVTVYTDDIPAAFLSSSPSVGGRLVLYGTKALPLLAAPAQVAVVDAASHAAGSDRWGSVTVRAMDSQQQGQDVVRIEGLSASGGLAGSVTVKNGTNRGAVWIAAEDGGPFLLITDGDEWCMITPTGIQAKHKEHNDFVAPHPEDATSSIHYSVLEGPEAGVYVRGSVPLVRGVARVALPDHFGHVASEAGLTAHLTPRSRASRGVAVTTLSPRELVIEELGEGTGNYDVDYLIHGVRRGRESYRVVRPRTESDWSARLERIRNAQAVEQDPE
jgi:hypothetical protein